MDQTRTEDHVDEAAEEQSSDGGEATSRFGGGGRTVLAIGYVGLIVTVVLSLYFLLKAGSRLQAPPAETGGGAAGPRAMVSAAKILPHLLLAAIVILITCRLVGGLLKKVHQPHVIGEIIAGIMLGPSLLGKVWPAGFDFLFPIELMTYLDVLANLGLIFYMFLVGLELDFNLIRGRGHAAIWVSHSSIIAPFIMGVALSLWLYPVLGSGGRFSAFALFMGAAMAITAFPVLARILTDRGLYKTQLGTVALTVGAVDDITAWSMLAVIITIARATGVLSSLITIGIALLFTLFTIYAVRPLMLRVSQHYERRGKMSGTFLAVLFILLIFWALVTDKLQIHVIFGAFLFGAIMPHDAKFVQAITQKLEDFSVIFLLPFFFTFSGIRTNIFAIGTSPRMWLMTLVILAVAIAGKWGGSKLAARFAGLSWREAGALGVLVNCRGLTELIILNIGLQLLVLPSTAFAMMVIMAVVTTLMTEPALTIYYSREAQRRMIADETGAEPAEEEGEGDGEAAPTWRALVAVGRPDNAQRLVRAATLLERRDHSGDGHEEPEEVEVIILHVVETSGTEVSLAPSVQDHLIEEGADLLRPLVQVVDDVGSRAVPVVLPSGDVGETIVRIARRREVDLVVLGHHQAVFGERMLGGPVGHVLRHAEADVAVLVEPRTSPPLDLGDHSGILVPYGGGFHEDAGLELAVRLASATGAEVSLMGPATDDGADELEQRAAELSDRWGVVTQPIVVETDVSEALVERAHEFDLLVLGLSDRWVNQQELLQTVRHEVMQRARTPYLLVRRHNGAGGRWLTRWWRRLKRVPRQLLDVYRGTQAELEEAEEQTKQRMEEGEERDRDRGQEPQRSADARRSRSEPSGHETDNDARRRTGEAGSSRRTRAPSEQHQQRTSEEPALDRIVVAIVGGEQDAVAVEAALSIARAQNDIVVAAIGLVGDGSGRADGVRADAELTELDPGAMQRVGSALVRLVEQARALGVRVETGLSTSQRPVDAILGQVRSDADLIIVSRPGGSPVDPLMSAQDLDRLSQQAPCPVIVVDQDSSRAMARRGGHAGSETS
ncbi:MAG TPA: cation:proton antiporter [Nitriliruptorales bacterium]|nr:cation:proton antiporter [Nitriliruptorales bacterium]